MEIHFDSLLAILLVCSIPLFPLLIIAVAFLSARSRLKTTAQMRRDLGEGVYDQFLSNPRNKLTLRIMGGVLFVFALGLLTVLSLLIYSMGKAVGFDNRTYWLAIVIPFICSIPTGVGALLVIGYIGRRQDK